MTSGRFELVFLLWFIAVFCKSTQAATCTDFPSRCQADEYCIATSATEIVCVGCSSACDGCRASGPDNCLNCAVGYKPEFGLCVECENGRYGVNCTGTCHCLNQDLCRKDTGFCDAWKCARGYEVPPLCNKTCDDKNYGVNCADVCHCPVNDTCDIINGLCSSGKCAVEYGGPSCSVRFPKLVKPPVTVLVNCGRIRVSWDEWSEDRDLGQDPIGQYSLYVNKGENGTNWELYKSVFMVPDQAVYTIDVLSLEDDKFYRFRVDTHFSSDGKIKPATTGFPTETVLNACTVTLTTKIPVTTTTRSYIGEKVFNNMDIQILTANSIQVTWNITAKVTTLDFSVYITYKIDGISDCEKIDGTKFSLRSTDKFTSLPITGLELYRRYLITIEANGTNPLIYDKISKTVDTGELLPTGFVSDFITKDLTSTSVELSWSDVPCRGRGGLLVRYDILTTNLNNSVIITDKVNITGLILTSLQAYSTYSTRVRYVNSVGEGPYSALFYFQTSEAAPSSVVIDTLVPSETTIRVTFNPPAVPNGHVTEYSITYSDNSNFNFPTSLTHSANLGFIATVRNVRAYTLYYIKVRAQTVGGIGNYGLVKTIRTLQDIPSPPLSLALNFRNMTCLKLSWQPPIKPNGIINSYKVVLKEVLSTDSNSIVAGLITGLTTVQRCGMLPGTLYRFLITANNERGDSTPLTGDFWTEQGTPPVPPLPILVDSSFTSITIAINPVVISPGPKISYQIQLEKKTNSNRKRRHPLVPGYVTAELTQQEVASNQNFVIGDGKLYAGYHNIPLEANKFYSVYYVVISILNNSSKFAFSMMADPIKTVPLLQISTTTAAPVAETSTNIVLIVVIVVMLLLLLIAVIIGICIWLRRRRMPPPYKPHVTNEIDMSIYIHDYDPETYWNKVFSFRESRYIIAGRDMLASDPNDMNGYTICGPDNDRISFNKEFHSLPHHAKSASDSVAKSRRNKNKNRFPHLLPYDETRVVLKPDENSNSDYINASFIRDNKQRKTYIAAQSPFNEATVIDFWRMIYQQQIKTVVMITNIVEDEIVKCTQYWPDIDNTQITCGSFYLELIEVDEYADFTIRTIVIQNSTQAVKSEVCLFEYTTWPDHGVPRDPIPLLEMREKCLQHHDNDPGLILVHCGTGMSRTGVFIAVDTLIDQYHAEGRVSVFNFVKKMRKDRPFMVRTFGQYVFIYECLFDKFYAGDTVVGQDLKKIFHGLSKKNKKTGHSFLKDQFRLLEKFSFGPPLAKCSDALLPVNKLKNRYYDVIPHNIDRPILQTPGGIGRTNYINALFLDGYRKRKQFVVTQTPLHTTIIDFWKLVYDYDIKTIVMMENYDNKDDTCAKYWPDVKMKQFEPFIIEAFTVCQKDNITSRIFKIHNLQNPNETPKIVCQFQYNDWSEPNFVPVSKTMMLDLIDLVNEWQITSNQNTSPILVHCKDGATHSGIFTSLFVVCEKMANDDEVDVFHTIRHLKKQRKQIVCQMEQFRFIYKALWDFINLRMEGGTLTDKMEKTNESFELESSPSLQSFYDTYA